MESVEPIRLTPFSAKNKMKDLNSRYKRLDSYILGKYLKTFIVAMILIIIIVITFDVSEKLDDFLRHQAPLKEIIFDYYCNFIPGFVNLYSPLFIFISVIYFTAKMAGNSEIIAILGSGISYRRMLKPYLHGSIIIALIVLLLGNFVIPISNQTLNKFEDQYVKTIRRTYYNNIHFQQKKGTHVYADNFDVRTLTSYNFTMDTYNDDGQLTERMQATSIVFDTTQNMWKCQNLVKRTIENGKETLLRPNSASSTLHGLTVYDFDRAAHHITTMNTPELIAHIRQEKMRGSGAVIDAKIEFYQRILTPLAVIVMTFIGVAISSRKTRGGVGVHLAIGISIAFAFIVFMKISTVFATNGNLPPFLAVLMPQILFGSAAAYLIHKAPK